MFMWQFIEELTDDLATFQFIKLRKVLSSKQIEVVLNNAIAKRVEGTDMHFMRCGSNERHQPFTHRLHTRIGKCQTQYIIRLRIGDGQNLPNTCRKDMRFARSRPSDNEGRSVNMLNCCTLLCIERRERLDEIFIEIGHSAV